MSVNSIRPVTTGEWSASPVTTTIATTPDTTRHGVVSLCSLRLDTEPGPAGTILVLRVVGEIDLLTVPMLEHALDAVIDQRPGDLVVDLAGVGFCCVHGFALLADAAATAQTNGTGYALSGLSPHLDRIATLLWPEQPGLRYRSAAAAVTAIRIDHTYQPT